MLLPFWAHWDRDYGMILGTLRWAGLPCYDSHVTGILTNLPELLYASFVVPLKRLSRTLH